MKILIGTIFALSLFMVSCGSGSKEPQLQPEDEGASGVDETCLKECLRQSMAHSVAWEVIEERCKRQCQQK